MQSFEIKFMDGTSQFVEAENFEFEEDTVNFYSGEQVVAFAHKGRVEAVIPAADEVEAWAPPGAAG